MGVYEEVKDIFVQVCNLEEDEITPATNMALDVTIDSIDFMDATYEIDQKYGIKMPLELWIADVNASKDGATDRFILSRMCEEIERLRAPVN